MNKPHLIGALNAVHALLSDEHSEPVVIVC